MLPWTVIPAPASNRLKHISLSGSGEYLAKTSGLPSLGIANAWSIMFMARPTRASFTVTEALVEFGNDGSSGFTPNEVAVRLSGVEANDPLRVTCSTSGNVVFKDLRWNSFFTTNVGVHVVLTFNGSASGDPLLLYKNGSLLGHNSGTNNTGTMTDISRRVGVGTSPGFPGSNLFQGDAGDVAVWNSVLSAAEAADIYNRRKSINLAADSGTYASSANLKHWWRLGFDLADIGADYGSGTTIDIMDNASGIDSSDVVAGGVV